MEGLLRVILFGLGAALTAWTLAAAIRTFVLPRSDNVFLTRFVFQSLFRLFQVRLKWADSYYERDRILAFFAPIGLLLQPVVWITLVMLGYTGMFLAVGTDLPLSDPQAWYDAFWLSGSSLLTLGFTPVENLAEMILAFSEATLGLGLIALLIAYLPTMHDAFTKREAAVTMLEVRAGSPPSAVEMLKRMHRIHGLDNLHDVWLRWEEWFVEVEQTHTSHAPLVYFRSPHPGQSWVVAAGTILDAAALTAAAVDLPHDPQADLCIRSGYLTLRSIVDFFGIPHNDDPRPDDPISVTRPEFNAVYYELARAGVPMKPDCDRAWRDFAGWRVNYDQVLLILAGLTMAPKAPWSGDRAQAGLRPSLFRREGKENSRLERVR